jgi:hypothetical protein
MTPEKKLVPPHRRNDRGHGERGGRGRATGFGYGFRAYPNAESSSSRDYCERAHLRDRSAQRLLVLDIQKSCGRAAPAAGADDWFATEVRTLTFSRPMPLQIRGEAVSSR